MWVQYSAYLRKSGQAMKVSMVALEHEGGGQWVEIGITNSRRRTLLYKMLIKGSIGRPGGLLRAIVQPPGQQPLEVPQKLTRTLPLMNTGRNPAAKLRSTGPVKVAAGTFKARRFRRVTKGKISETWFSSQVPGWTMVKARTPHVLLELASHGTSGRSKIRGKPGKLDEGMLRQLGIIK